MAIRSEVVVIGGGLAGRTAALAAAADGATVRLLSAAETTLTQASGLVDVLGYPPGSARGDPIADPFVAVDDLPDRHPYARVGQDAIREGLALFDDAVGDAYCGGHADENALVPTPVGTVKPTARYPRSVAPGLASRREDALLVGFGELPGFDAPFVADRLDSLLPYRVDGTTVSFPGDYPADVASLRLSRALDGDESTGDGGRGTRDRLCERVRPHLDGHGRVGFPAVLGREAHAEVRRHLAEGLGVDVFEVPTAPPSVPGLRLADRLDAALAEAGVHVTTGHPVVDHDADGGRIATVVVDREGSRVPYAAESFVLATGGLVGKGIDSDREGVREPVFDCHVPHPADRTAWYADDPFGDHRFARFGVRVDDRCRPLDPDGDPSFANLRAAGSVVGGADTARESSAAGVSLATGVVAGRGAVDEVI